MLSIRSIQDHLTRVTLKTAGNLIGSNSSSPLVLHQFLNERAGHVGRNPHVATYEGAFVQYGLSTVQGRNIGALEESPDRDLITPEERFFHRGHPIGRVVSGIVLELLNAWTEPLIGVVVIIGDTRAEDIQEGEAFVLDTLLDQFCEVLLLTAEATRDKRDRKSTRLNS